MACVTKRRGKWAVDYRDGAGVRRVRFFDTRQEAEDYYARVIPESRQLLRPAVDSKITMAAYADRWLGQIAATVKPRTYESYSKTLGLHILPMFGAMKVRLLHRGQIRALLTRKLAEGKVRTLTEGGLIREVRGPLARNSVRIIHAALRVMLNAAIEDGLLVANPADKLGRSLRLAVSPNVRQEEIKAFTREQVSSFLATSAALKGSERRYHPFFLLLARTGMRMGEALALQWNDIDFRGRQIRIVRAFSVGRIETPKSGHGRTVDVSDQLAGALLRLQVERKAEVLRQGWPEIPLWVFCNEAGMPLDGSRIRKTFAKILEAAGLPPHFTPHCLRHTYASLLLQQRESPVYVQRQLGHASIKLTVDTYGKWLPLGNKAAVNRLDDQSGSKMVTTYESESEGAI
jgi:integrase